MEDTLMQALGLSEVLFLSSFVLRHSVPNELNHDKQGLGLPIILARQTQKKLAVVSHYRREQVSPY